MSKVSPAAATKTKSVVGKIQLASVLASLGLLAAKGLGVNVSWLTILGVLAIPGAIGAISVAILVIAALILGLLYLAAGDSDK